MVVRNIRLNFHKNDLLQWGMPTLSTICHCFCLVTCHILFPRWLSSIIATMNVIPPTPTADAHLRLWKYLIYSFNEDETRCWLTTAFCETPVWKNSRPGSLAFCLLRRCYHFPSLSRAAPGLWKLPAHFTKTIRSPPISALVRLLHRENVCVLICWTFSLSPCTHVSVLLFCDNVGVPDTCSLTSRNKLGVYLPRRKM